MIRFLTCIAACSVCALAARAQNEIPVTYQGRLTVAGSPANGSYDVQFRVYDAEVGGSQIGPSTFVNGVSVVDGLLQTEFNYPRDGAADEARWLEIWVRPGGGLAFLQLSGRQRISAAPEAGNTFGARLQPNGDVLIGSGAPLGLGDGLDIYVSPPDVSFLGETVSQTFIAQASGTPTVIEGFFNTASVGTVDIAVEIISTSGQGAIATGSALNIDDPLGSIAIDQTTGLLLCGEPYTLVINYTKSGQGVPETKARTGVLLNDPYPDGQLGGQPTVDMDVRIVVDRGASQVTVFDDGLALLNGGLIVGPDDGGDAAVVLPKGSVGPQEMLGVPGIGQGQAPEQGDPVTLIRRVRIEAPTDGYVLAHGNATLAVSSFSGSVSLLLVGSSGDLFTSTVSAGGSQSNFNMQAAVQGVFPVAAGEVLVLEMSRSGNTSAGSPQLNAMFFPVDYSVP